MFAVSVEGLWTQCQEDEEALKQSSGRNPVGNRQRKGQAMVGRQVRVFTRTYQDQHRPTVGGQMRAFTRTYQDQHSEYYRHGGSFSQDSRASRSKAMLVEGFVSSEASLPAWQVVVALFHVHANPDLFLRTPVILVWVSHMQQTGRIVFLFICA